MVNIHTVFLQSIIPFCLEYKPLPSRILKMIFLSWAFCLYMWMCKLFIQTYSTIMVASEPMGDNSDHPEFCQLNMFFVVCHSLILSLLSGDKVNSQQSNRDSPQNYSKNIFFHLKEHDSFEKMCHNTKDPVIILSHAHFSPCIYIYPSKKNWYELQAININICFPSNIEIETVICGAQSSKN